MATYMLKNVLLPLDHEKLKNNIILLTIECLGYGQLEFLVSTQKALSTGIAIQEAYISITIL